MDAALNMINKCLHQIVDEGIPKHTLEYLYIKGYMTFEEFKRSYICESGTTIPKLEYVEPEDIVLAINSKCDREQEVEDFKLELLRVEEESLMFKNMFE